MRIAFITSCLEPSRDGVGDYLLELSRECVRQGHDCCLVAGRDPWVEQPQEEPPSRDAMARSILRLPVTLPWPQVGDRVREFLRSFQPDWIGLQLVPYGWHPKGILAGIAPHLRSMVGETPVHVMCHELWVGNDLDASLKLRAVGAIQQLFLLRLLRQLQPRVIHTSNPAYRLRLQRCGFEAIELPLFGNIPVAEQTADAWLWPQLQARGLAIDERTRSSYWLIGLFGALYPNWEPEPLLTHLTEAAASLQKTVAILSAGYLKTGEGLWAELERRYGDRFHWLKLGPLPPRKISEYLLSLDAGLAASPYSLIGKSGTVAATIDHGLPVIASFEKPQRGIPTPPPPISFQSRVISPYEPLLERLKQGFDKQPPRSRLPEVASQFLADLAAALP